MVLSSPILLPVQATRCRAVPGAGALPRHCRRV